VLVPAVAPPAPPAPPLDELDVAPFVVDRASLPLPQPLVAHATAQPSTDAVRRKLIQAIVIQRPSGAKQRASCCAFGRARVGELGDAAVDRRAVPR
jgi:hypothetical protein